MELSGIRLGPVRLRVADLGRSREWYGRVLGLRPAGGTGGARRATLVTEGGEPLVTLRERPGARPHPARGRLGLFHFAILLPDRSSLGRFYAHALALGVPLGASDHLVSEALYLSDPDGLGIEVYADRPRADWPRERGRLAMDTLPLDAASLLTAGAGEPWEGMPAGAAIGHLHLHVGDLEAAEAFYSGGLGLTPTVRGYPGALFLAADGYHHHLGLNTWSGPASTPATEADAGLDLWEIVLPGAGALQDALARLRAAGAAPAADGSSDAKAEGSAHVEGIGPGERGGTPPAGVAVVADPWGTRLGLRG